MAGYRVNLDIFAGPLDLLLYLVRKDEVDVYDIPIASVTEQYVKYVEMIKMFDIDLAGDFLVMAATLMEIKSAMLLPRAEVEEAEQEAVDPRSELVRQLLEYKKFKDAANMLQDSSAQRLERFTRPDTVIASIKVNDEPELDLDQVNVWTLLEAFDDIMQSIGQRPRDYSHISDETPIDLYQIEILHRLQTEGATTFRDIFKGRENRLVMIGLFLAMLELIRDRLIMIEQSEENQKEIYVRALTDEPAEQAVQNAIYKSHDEDEQTAEASDNTNAETDQTENLPESQQPIDDDQSEDTTPQGSRFRIVELPAENAVTPEKATVESTQDDLASPE